MCLFWVKVLFDCLGFNVGRDVWCITLLFIFVLCVLRFAIFVVLFCDSSVLLVIVVCLCGLIVID